jgi:hypothetical protein
MTTTVHTYTGVHQFGDEQQCIIDRGLLLPKYKQITPQAPLPAGASWGESIQTMNVPGNAWNTSVRYRVVYILPNGSNTYPSGPTPEIPTKGVGMPMLRFVPPSGVSKAEIFRQVNDIYANNSMGSLNYLNNMERFHGNWYKVATISDPARTLWLDSTPIRTCG